MIINSLPNEKPYKEFKNLYDLAYELNQPAIESINISSFSKEKNEVDSRFVNLKIIEGHEFIFFSNYNSPKSKQFLLHDQIAANIYWSSLNIQIRIKAKIKKTPQAFNEKYFMARDDRKNALAISSKQSRVIDSYQQVVDKYNFALVNNNLKICPDYWGGFAFKPYEFEFWTGHKSRLNKRVKFVSNNKTWLETILEP